MNELVNDRLLAKVFVYACPWPVIGADALGSVNSVGPVRLLSVYLEIAPTNSGLAVNDLPQSNTKILDLFLTSSSSLLFFCLILFG